MNSDEDGIRAVMILEILGKPPEHLKETLGKMIEAIGKEKGIEVKSSKINEPIELPENKELYTTFAEVEMEIKSILHLSFIMFKYMPAHVDIISPEEIKVSHNSLNEVFNELARKLHAYDEVARIIHAERKILEQRLKTIMEKENPEKAEKTKKEK